MAAMFNQVKFTAKERRAIDAGWYALCDIADRTGSTGADYLRKALKAETTGPQSVPLMFAKGLLCQWFLNHTTGHHTIADLYGTRDAAILVALLAHASIAHHGLPGTIALGSLREAAAALTLPPWACAIRHGPNGEGHTDPRHAAASSYLT